MEAPQAGWRSRRYLPHFDAPDAVQHVVFRLADSLPPGLLADVHALPSMLRMEAAEADLDAGLGSRALATPAVATLVQDALLHFDGERYRLVAWCVMPTHVHVLAVQIAGWRLSQVVHAWKSYTSKCANRLLSRRGRFWAAEYYDRFMRDEDQLEATGAYIENNPVAAGLCAEPAAWPWSSARADHGGAR